MFLELDRYIPKCLFVFLACGGFSGALHAIDLSNVNFSYKYDDASPVSVTSRITKKQNLYRLDFELTYNETPDSLTTVGLYFQVDYSDGSKQANTAISPQFRSTINSGRQTFWHEFEPDSLNKLVVIAIAMRGSAYYYDYPISSPVNFDPPDFTLLTENSQPLFDSYLGEGQPLLVDSLGLYVFTYTADFPPASPPMTVKTTANKNLTVDSTQFVRETFKANEGKLYLFQRDTTTLEAIGVLGVTLLYPKLISIQDLVDPLVYISTKNQFSQLKAAGNPKVAMDKFWLNMIDDRAMALSTIKNYYRRVTASNRLFTTYKEGWKTDMGMIYVLFGKPTTVRATLINETWTYSHLNGKEIVFMFDKVKNIFTPDHYVLNRSNDYRDSWYRQVDLWRKGRI